MDFEEIARQWEQPTHRVEKQCNSFGLWENIKNIAYVFKFVFFWFSVGMIALWFLLQLLK